MKTRIIGIGNSRGIRIPKSFLQRSKLTEEVEIEAFDSYIVIRSTAKKPREGWEEHFGLRLIA
jgi:antitoxin MazE